MKEQIEDNQSFKSTFWNYTLFGKSTYYNNFFERNFKTFDDKLFQRNKDKQGNYFEYSQNEIVEKIWNNGNCKK